MESSKWNMHNQENDDTQEIRIILRRFWMTKLLMQTHKFVLAEGHTPITMEKTDVGT